MGEGGQAPRPGWGFEGAGSGMEHHGVDSGIPLGASGEGDLMCPGCQENFSAAVWNRQRSPGADKLQGC